MMTDPAALAALVERLRQWLDTQTVQDPEPTVDEWFCVCCKQWENKHLEWCPVPSVEQAAAAITELERERDELNDRLSTAAMALGFPISRPHIQRYESLAQDNDNLCTHVAELEARLAAAESKIAKVQQLMADNPSWGLAAMVCDALAAHAKEGGDR